MMEENVDSPRRKAAQKMSDIEREDKLFELNELYKNWRNSGDKDIQEQMNLLQVSCHLSHRLIKTNHRYMACKVMNIAVHQIWYSVK